MEHLKQERKSRHLTPRHPGAQLTRSQLLRLLGASERQFSAWERKGWIQPLAAPDSGPGGREDLHTKGSSPLRQQQPAYTFADAAALKTILELRHSGVSASLLRSLQATIQDSAKPSCANHAWRASHAWNDLQIRKHGKQVSVSYRGARIEPVTGQFLLEFDPRRKDIKVRPMNAARRRRSNEAERRARADRCFIAGLRFEESTETIPKAIKAYQKAIELNPRALGAFINLGTIYYHQHALEEAERAYRAALALNPGSALVHFNLGNLLEERDQADAARSHYDEAIRLDPAYPDPCFNLALLYERMGRHGKACQQWRAYLRLDSESRWSAYARQKLQQIPLRVISSSKSHNERG